MSTLRDRILERISINPKVCFGKPVIKGTRIWVSLVLNFLANGMSVEEILSEYPHITREDILACIAYGADAADERFIEVPIGGGKMAFRSRARSSRRFWFFRPASGLRHVRTPSFLAKTTSNSHCFVGLALRPSAMPS